MCCGFVELGFEIAVRLRDASGRGKIFVHTPEFEPQGSAGARNPIALTRQRKKKTSDSEDEDFEIEKVSSKKKVLKK